MSIGSYLSVPEAAKLAGVSEFTLRKAIREGLLPIQLVGTTKAVSKAALMSYRMRREPADTLSVPATAKALGLTRSTVYTLIKLGRLKEVSRIAKRPRVTVESVNEYAATRRVRA
jgi:excisionase family DNA binding protein